MTLLGAIFSLALVFLGIIVGIVFKIPQKGGLDVRRKETVIKFVFFMSFASAIVMAFSVLGLFGSLLWWVGVDFLVINSPKRLAWGSVILGIFPLLISGLSAVVAKSIGGSLHEGGYENCNVFGLDVGRVLYAMYVSVWLTIFTGGIAFFGLIAALIWTLSR